MEISVIIPVYNGRKYIEKAVLSALDQSQTGEVILIDDGSTDDSLQICQQLANIESRIVLACHENRANKGIAQSSNLGIKIAKFPYVTFLDQDDFYLPNRFDRSLDILEKNKNIDGVYGKAKNFSKNPNNQYVQSHSIIKNLRKVEPENLFLYLIQDFNPHFAHCSVVYRSDKIKKIHFDADILYGTDLDFLYQTSFALKLIDEDASPKIMRRIHDSNLSYSSQFNDYDPRLKMAEKWFQKIREGNFSKEVNRALYYRLVTRKYFNRYGDELSLKRFPIKIFFGLKILISNPWILLKL